MVDARENEKAIEKLHVFENKLFNAEQNREKEIQKKLENLRRHVRFLSFCINFVVVESVFAFVFFFFLFRFAIHSSQSFHTAVNPYAHTRILIPFSVRFLFHLLLGSSC